MWDFNYKFNDGNLSGFEVCSTSNGRYKTKQEAYLAANEAVGEF